MNKIRTHFHTRGFDATEYARFVHRHQDEATRIKLRCIEDFASGQEYPALAKSLGIHPQSCRLYIHTLSTIQKL
ncbi:MAG: hypothetical protein EAZ92_04495 [Candidatus Kapaibacterium sp.]|nr:MAG: hypothetical protein EAZ92_04495 [Candidatus Kapabacteria bacterium]